MEVLDAFKQGPDSFGDFFVRKSSFLLFSSFNERFQCASRNEFHEQIQTVVCFLKRMEFHNIRVTNGLQNVGLFSEPMQFFLSEILFVKNLQFKQGVLSQHKFVSCEGCSTHRQCQKILFRFCCVRAVVFILQYASLI